MRSTLCIVLALVIACAVVACGGGASLGPQARIFEFGLYARGTEVVRPNPNAPSGQSRSSVGYKLDKQTSLVPLALGVSFGLCFEIVGVGGRVPPSVLVQVTHPQIVRPDGAVFTSYQAQPGMYWYEGVFWTCLGYGFDHEYELVPGNWRFTVIVDGVPQVWQDFVAQ